MRFITHTNGLHLNAYQGSDVSDMIEAIHDEPFHLNRQLKSIGRLRSNTL